MNKFVFLTISLLTAALFSTGAFLIYQQNETINSYTKQLLGIKKDFSTLQTEYDVFKTQVKKVYIIANNAASKHNAVSNIITNYTGDKKNQVSVYYKNLNTDEVISVDGDRQYYMASLYKVILVLYLLDQSGKGELSLTDQVGTSSATLDQAIDKIITESNNEYAQTLATQYGWKNIEKDMREKLGVEFSFNSDLQINANTMGRIFEEIASSLRISDWESEYLLLLMNNQKKTSKLPKYLPTNIYSHNKTGEFEGYSHDAGIFYTPKANYVLVVLTKSGNPSLMNETMAKMSKEIFDALNQPPS